MTADELEKIAARLRALGESCDAVSVIAAGHPSIGRASRALETEGKPVVVSSPIGRRPIARATSEPRKPGRAAVCLIARAVHRPGRAASLIGKHKVASAAHEEPDEACRIVCELLAGFDEMIGICIVGDGASRGLKALREAPREKRRTIRLVWRDIGSETPMGLTEGFRDPHAGELVMALQWSGGVPPTFVSYGRPGVVEGLDGPAAQAPAAVVAVAAMGAPPRGGRSIADPIAGAFVTPRCGPRR